MQYKLQFNLTLKHNTYGDKEINKYIFFYIYIYIGYAWQIYSNQNVVLSGYYRNAMYKSKYIDGIADLI